MINRVCNIELNVDLQTKENKKIVLIMTISVTCTLAFSTHPLTIKGILLFDNKGVSWVTNGGHG